MTPPRTAVAVAAAVLALDIGTKSWAAAALEDRSVALFGGRLMLRESRNPGAAFSVATGQTLLISLVAVGVVVFLAVRARRVDSQRQAVVWGLLGGGAAGNLVDRLFRSPGPLRGHVVDWLDLGWFPSFNLADSAITLGAVGLLALALRPTAESATGPDTGEPDTGGTEPPAAPATAPPRADGPRPLAVPPVTPPR